MKTSWTGAAGSKTSRKAGGKSREPPGPGACLARAVGFFPTPSRKVVGNEHFRAPLGQAGSEHSISGTHFLTDISQCSPEK